METEESEQAWREGWKEEGLEKLENPRNASGRRYDFACWWRWWLVRKAVLALFPFGALCSISSMEPAIIWQLVQGMELTAIPPVFPSQPFELGWKVGMECLLHTRA
jgi:hypothetical protein